MAFNFEQENYKALREIVAQKTRQIVVVAGAGISAQAPANLPLWPKLKKMLSREATSKIQTLEEKEKQRRGHIISLAESEDNYWQAFSYLKTALGETSFRENIRRAFARADDCSPPSVYSRLWKLGISGMVTTNVDRFAGRSFAEVHQSKPLTEFCGIEVGNYAHTFQSGRPFVANIHGILGNEASWIFTSEDLTRLKSASFRSFFNQCFNSRTLLFIGISADDFAIEDHLRRLKDDGVKFGSHYWLTHRNDKGTDEFAEANSLLRIAYTLGSEPEQHKEVNEFLDDLERHVSRDIVPPIVIPEGRKERNISLPPPEKLQTLSSEEIRQSLNQEAVRILRSNSETREEDYAALIKRYDECVYRLWNVTDKPPNNILFGYKIESRISKGGFGMVYRAISPDGEQVAIKVLLVNIRDDQSLLEGFRRGVNAMHILAERKIEGIVAYKKSWELPACVVMDYIEGYTLEEAVEAQFIKSWRTKMRIGMRLVSILQTAHSIPEHVLHRDLRPPNIMLRGFASPDDEGSWDVVVLDFDLCWHKNATGNSVDPNSITIAYHAPEQFQHTEKASRRSALVDSFGIGMTLYFMVSGRHPQPYSVQNDTFWENDLKLNVSRLSCSQWKSIPRRMARLIYWSTRHDQQLRWDLTKISGELKRLNACLNGSSLNDPELIAEEIASQCERMSEYTWGDDPPRAIITTVTGFDFSIRGNEGNQRIEASISWSNLGDRDYSTVKKYLLPNIDKVVAELKVGNWSATIITRGYDQVKIEATIDLSRIKSAADLTKLAKAFSVAASCLRLN